MKWNGFVINPNLIKVTTAKSVLIGMPTTSSYKGFSFWHSSKLVKTGKMYMLLYTDDFVFHLKKYGHGRFNQREVLEEIDLSPEDIKDRIASTIRHNRARGEHNVTQMSNIVAELVMLGWEDEEIGKQLGMQADEVLRLKQNTGIAEIFKNHEYSHSWV